MIVHYKKPPSFPEGHDWEVPHYATDDAVFIVCKKCRQALFYASSIEDFEPDSSFAKHNVKEVKNSWVRCGWSTCTRHPLKPVSCQEEIEAKIMDKALK